MFEGKQKAYDVCCKLCVVCVCCVLFGVPIRPSPFDLKGPVPLQVYVLVVIREDRTDRVGAAGECA